MAGMDSQEAGLEGAMRASSTQVVDAGGFVNPLAVAAGRTLVVIPTYNERENIERLIRELLAVSASLAVMIVDDASPDGTGRIAQRLADDTGRAIVHHRPGKLGIGSAYLDGFRQGLTLGYEFIMTMDADFSHDPQRVPSLLEGMTDADVVIGSRYRRGGAIRQWPLSRRVLSRGANSLAKVCLGLQANDCTSGFRCYRRDVLASLQLDQIKSQGYSCLVELLFACQARGWRIAEVPISFVDRQFGRTKISQREVYRGAWTLLRLGARRWQ